MSDALKFKNDKPVFAVSTGRMDWNQTGSWRYMRPRYEDKLPPCTAGCPTHERIPQYFDLVKKGDFAAAWEIILEDNPLPGVCGRVCYHPCEDVCNRGEFDEQISINAMERFVADQNLERQFPEHFHAKPNGHTVAVVGSGPAGLSAAYQLARRGDAVTIYEGADEPGGMLRQGIPSYRLPRDILDKEIADIQSLGVEIKTGQHLGRNMTIEELNTQFEAVILALGAYKGQNPKLPGLDLPGVTSALDFLQEFNLTGKSDLPDHVMVVGGGNTAIDAARSARRLGVEVDLVYRRSRNEMPAVSEEIDAALEEGVQLRTLTNPVAFLGDDHLTAVQVIQMELGEPDESGRRRPIPVPGTEVTMETTRVLMAIGETPDLDAIAGLPELSTNRIAVSKGQSTSLDGVFACGDVAAGPIGTVVDAIATGKQAALDVHAFLGGETTGIENREPVQYSDLNLNYFLKEKRPDVPHLPFSEAIQSFAEVNDGLSTDVARKEAERCFSCGTCISCDLCLIFCPDVAIHPGTNGALYDIDYDFCKGCGVCVAECPRDAMTFEEELSCAN